MVKETWSLQQGSICMRDPTVSKTDSTQELLTEILKPSQCESN